MTRVTLYKRLIVLMVGLFALGFASAAYLRPEFIVDLGNQLMLCF
jgi:uncharacterized membrane protein YczE